MLTYISIVSVLDSCLCTTSLNLFRIESPVRNPPVSLTTEPIPEVHAVSASCFVESAHQVYVLLFNFEFSLKSTIFHKLFTTGTFLCVCTQRLDETLPHFTKLSAINCSKTIIGTLHDRIIKEKWGERMAWGQKFEVISKQKMVVF